MNILLLSMPDSFEHMPTVAIRMPSHPIAQALLQGTGFSLAAPSANRFGRISPTSAEAVFHELHDRIPMILDGGPSDLTAGHELVKKTCLVCHKLYGEGADVGPDLTGVGRSTLDALLANVIDPSQVVGKGYENVMIETRDGRSLSGRLAENTDTRVKLLSAGPKEDVIAKSDIAEMRVSELSVMPEGLEQMPDNDFRNLILYVLHPPQETRACDGSCCSGQQSTAAASRPLAASSVQNGDDGNQRGRLLAARLRELWARPRRGTFPARS